MRGKIKRRPQAPGHKRRGVSVPYAAASSASKSWIIISLLLAISASCAGVRSQFAIVWPLQRAEYADHVKAPERAYAAPPLSRSIRASYEPQAPPASAPAPTVEHVRAEDFKAPDPKAQCQFVGCLQRMGLRRCVHPYAMVGRTIATAVPTSSPRQCTAQIVPVVE